MPVRQDEDGRRYVDAEVEVPGSPAEVWRAIATAEGISSWFMPTTSAADAEGRPSRMITSFGPGMDAVATIKEWNPPHRYVAESDDAGAEAAGAEAGPRNVATEWIVEARAGGACVVRVVHRWFADSGDWDGEFEGHAYGWAASFFRILNLYLTHFSGRKCADVQLTAFSQAPALETWRTLTSALEIDQGTRRFTSTQGMPPLSGTVEHMEVTDPELLRVRERAPQIVATLAAMDGEDSELLLRLDRPGPGIAYMFVMPMGDQAMVSMRIFLYGDEAASIAAETERRWNEWLTERFPAEAHAESKGPM